MKVKIEVDDERLATALKQANDEASAKKQLDEGDVARIIKIFASSFTFVVEE